MAVRLCRGRRPRGGQNKAEKRLGELYAGLNLFSIDDRYAIKGSNALVIDEAEVKTIVRHHRLGSHYLGDYASKLFKVDLLFSVQQRLQGTSPSDASQLAAALEYHRLALLATSDEARLVNLWIALEALCQGGEGSIIERVWSRISPCVSVENVRKNLISLSIYVKELWEHAAAPFLALFPNSSGTRLEPGDLAAVLLLPNGQANLQTLCNLCASSPHPPPPVPSQKHDPECGEVGRLQSRTDMPQRRVADQADLPGQERYRSHRDAARCCPNSLSTCTATSSRRSIPSSSTSTASQSGPSAIRWSTGRSSSSTWCNSSAKRRTMRSVLQPSLIPRSCMRPQTAPFAWPPPAPAAAPAPAIPAPRERGNLTS